VIGGDSDDETRQALFDPAKAVDAFHLLNWPK
jgi:hypothetical protein